MGTGHTAEVQFTASLAADLLPPSVISGSSAWWARGDMKVLAWPQAHRHKNNMYNEALDKTPGPPGVSQVGKGVQGGEGLTRAARSSCPAVS